MSLGKLDKILSKDGFIIYISGAKEKGKTDFSLLLAEYCHLKGFRTKLTTNIETESYMIEKQITNLPDLQAWLKEKGRKLFILDEAGLSVAKLRFMSQINVEVMKILQMIRHYDAGFIGVAPSSKNVDSTFMDTDILDAHIKKLRKDTAIVKDYLENESYFLEDICKTSINFNSKHIAEFKLEKEIRREELPICCQIALSYTDTKNFADTAKLFKLSTEEVKRKVIDHLKHSQITNNNYHGGMVNHKSSPETVKSPLS